MPSSVSATPTGSDSKAASGRHSAANVSSGRYDWRDGDHVIDASLAQYDMDMPAVGSQGENESGKHDLPSGMATPLITSERYGDADVHAALGLSSVSKDSHSRAVAAIASMLGGRSAAAFGRKTKAQDDVREHVRAVIDQNQALRSPLVVRNLTLTYFLTVGVVMLLSIGGQLAVHFAIRNSNSDAVIVNISGRQRMLSQMISKDALAIVHGRESGANVTYFVSELAAKLPLWNTSHYGLWHGSSELGLPGTGNQGILALFNQSYGNFLAMMASAQVLLALNLTALQPGTTAFA